MPVPFSRVLKHHGWLAPAVRNWLADRWLFRQNELAGAGNAQAVFFAPVQDTYLILPAEQPLAGYGLTSVQDQVAGALAGSARCRVLVHEQILCECELFAFSLLRPSLSSPNTGMGSDTVLHVKGELWVERLAGFDDAVD
ncbi:MAG: hypothetical protein WHV61_10860, partial [Burkholderiales bacterium]